MPLRKFTVSVRFGLVAAMSALAVPALMPATALAEPDLEIYAELPRTMGVSLSPNGRRLATLGPYKGKRGIFIYDLSQAEAAPKVMPTPKGSIVKNITWGSDDHILFQATFNRRGQGRMRKYGSRFSRWVSTNVNTGNSVIMMDDRIGDDTPLGSRAGSANRRAFGGGFVSRLQNDPDHVLMSWGEYTGKPVLRHFKVNLNTGDEGITRSLDIRTNGVLLNADGTELLARSEYSDRSGEYKIISYQGDEEKTVYTRKFDTDRNPTLALLQVLPGNGNILVYEGELDSPKFFTIDPATGVQADYNINAPLPSGYDYFPIFDPFTDEFIGINYTDDYTQFVYTAEPYKSWHAKAKRAFPGKQVSIVSRTRDNSMVTLSVSGPKDPGSYYLYEPDKGQASPIGDAYPELRPSDIGETYRINYTARDGLEIPGYVTLPVGKSKFEGPFPLVAMPHGGPIGPRDDASFDFWAQFLSSRGYAVFKPQFRGSGGFGYSFLEKGYKKFGTGMITDTIDGINYLASQNVINPDKVCVTGGSYGGYQSLQLPVAAPDMIKCAISVNGVSDIVEILKFESARSGGRNSGTIKFWNRVIGDYNDDREQMREISPALNVEKIKAEILLFHGEDDLTVPINQSEIMAKALKKIGQDNKIYMLPGDDHNLSLAESRRKLLEVSETFFAKHLK